MRSIIEYCKLYTHFIEYFYVYFPLFITHGYVNIGKEIKVTKVIDACNKFINYLI